MNLFFFLLLGLAGWGAALLKGFQIILLSQGVGVENGLGIVVNKVQMVFGIFC